MKLNKQQIENLYKFTRQHYVVHYDLQTELVDHMATSIENVWKNNPEIPFETARDASFKTFGVFGFMDVVENRQKAMSKRYRSIIWLYLKEWFKLPKLIITTLIFFLSLAVFSLKQGDFIAQICFYTVIIGSFIFNYKYLKYVKRKEKHKEKLWLLEDLIFRNAAMGDIILVSNLYNIRAVVVILNSISSYNYVTALVFTLLILYVYIKCRVIPLNAEKLLKNTYPQYSM